MLPSLIFGQPLHLENAITEAVLLPVLANFQIHASCGCVCSLALRKECLNRTVKLMVASDGNTVQKFPERQCLLTSIDTRLLQ